MNKKKIILSFGSNLGDRKNNILEGIRLLQEKGVIEVNKTSSFLENPALLLEGSPKEWDINFYNLVLSGFTHHDPEYIIKEIENVENVIGRAKERKKWAPREIDIDILFYEDMVVDSDISIPHKEFLNRIFLISLLNEIEPDYIYPGENKFKNWKISEIYNELRYEKI